MPKGALDVLSVLQQSQSWSVSREKICFELLGIDLLCCIDCSVDCGTLYTLHLAEASYFLILCIIRGVYSVIVFYACSRIVHLLLLSCLFFILFLNWLFIHCPMNELRSCETFYHNLPNSPRKEEAMSHYHYCFGFDCQVTLDTWNLLSAMF